MQFAPQLAHAARAAKTAATGPPDHPLQHAHPDVGIESVRTPFPELTPALLAGDVDVVLTFGPSPGPDVTSTRLSEIHRVGLVGSTHPLAFKRAVEVHESARLPMIFSLDLPEEYMQPFVLADVRPLEEATLVPISA